MKKRYLMLAAGLGVATWSVMGQSAKSIRDGVYSVEQAKRGRVAYSTHCFECHGRDLTGDVETRPLVGYEFTTNWADGNLLRLFDRVRITMPGDKPGTLNRQTVADILSFILQSNGYPAGNEELSTRSEILEQIKFEVPK